MSGELAEPLRVVSDLHLAHSSVRRFSVEALRPLLEGARTVVFNGDTCELVHDHWRVKSEELLAELRVLCGEVGAHPVFLTGNHDFEISRSGWLDLRDGAVLITHGDMFLPEVVPWSHQLIERKRRVHEVLRGRGNGTDSLDYHWETTRLVEDILRTSEDLTPPKRKAHWWSRSFWPPVRPFGVLQAWATMFGAAEEFVRHFRPEARVLLFGHFHRAGFRMQGSRLYVNTGAFMRGSRQLVIELEGEWLRIRPVTWEGERPRLETPAEVFRLSELSPAAGTERGEHRGPVR